MAVAYDALGAGAISASSASASWSHTTAANAYVICAISYLPYYTSTINAPTLDGTAMSLKGSEVNSGSSSYGVGVVYYEAFNVSSGAHTIAISSLSSSSYMNGNSISFTGVNSSSTAVVNLGTTHSASLAVTGSTSGSMLCASFGTRGVYIDFTWSWSGGTNKYSKAANSSDQLYLTFSTASADTTFTGSSGAASDNWSGIGVILSPATTNTATGALTGHGALTASVTVIQSTSPHLTGNGALSALGTTTVQYRTAALTGSGVLHGIHSGGGLLPWTLPIQLGVPGQSWISTFLSGHTALTATATPKMSAAAHFTGNGALAGPAIPPFPNTPLANVITKLLASQTVQLQAIGDSTTYGFGGSGGGWADQLTYLLAVQYNCAEKVAAYAATVGYSNYSTGYQGGGPNSVQMLNGGVNGAIIPGIESWIATGNLLFEAPTCDCIFFGEGFNDLSASGVTPAQFITAYLGLISTVRAKFPHTPIVCTTECVPQNDPYFAGFNALATNLTGNTLPLSPPLQLTNIPGVWMLDTRQAYSNVYQPSLMYNWEHPNQTGYDTQAQWMMGVLTGYLFPRLTGQGTLSATAAQVGAWYITGNLTGHGRLSAGDTPGGGTIVSNSYLHDRGVLSANTRISNSRTGALVGHGALALSHGSTIISRSANLAARGSLTAAAFQRFTNKVGHLAGRGALGVKGVPTRKFTTTLTGHGALSGKINVSHLHGSGVLEDDHYILYTASELTTFEVTGNWNDVESPDPNSSNNQSAFQIVTGFVTFYPRVPQGFNARFVRLQLTTGGNASTGVVMVPIQARSLGGVLQTIDLYNTVGITLPSNTSAMQTELNLIDPLWLAAHNVPAGELIYDVQFSKIIYADAAQFIGNFAFAAPADNTAICLTDPGLSRLPYGGP